TSKAPMRPGVFKTATHPMSARESFACRKASSIVGKRRCKCARAATSGTTPPNLACKSVWDAMTLARMRRSSVKTATAVSSQEVSMARKFMVGTRRSVNDHLGLSTLDGGKRHAHPVGGVRRQEVDAAVEEREVDALAAVAAAEGAGGVAGGEANILAA